MNERSPDKNASDFLLELRSEEIPARMQAGARAELEKLFRREMDAAGVAMGEVSVWSTPRRLALIARGLPNETQAVSEEAKGPPVGAPDQAVATWRSAARLSYSPYWLGSHSPRSRSN